jgi:hypothetical protein
MKKTEFILSHNIQRKFSYIVLSLLIGFVAQAKTHEELVARFEYLNKQDDSSAVCEDRLLRAGVFQIHKYYAKNSKTCYLSIQPIEKPNMIYRSYLFTNDGSFNIFNSFGIGKSSTTTGSRDYMLFPNILPNPAFQVFLEEDLLVVTATSNHKFYYSLTSGELIEVTEAQFKSTLNIAKNNGGGLELRLDRGLLLDSGFQVGKSPTEVKANSSRFINAKGQICKIKNSSLFKYYNDDVYFDWTEAQLKKLLKSQCPQFQF